MSITNIDTFPLTEYESECMLTPLASTEPEHLKWDMRNPCCSGVDDVGEFLEENKMEFKVYANISTI